ncbi:hypothetical protein AMATHDRAFT_138652 [Amanita thiersii Skay4041]|uniref:Peptidase M48 domain-containing protein n=1 Tax=Amanita thiersii Skay4041 TaxID=703135 RepID=A0A2A9NYH5_9AGAR|nr:hypothetical protein AMATHDRAFT_138652 [Amanita thiersii Skay4041]
MLRPISRSIPTLLPRRPLRPLQIPLARPLHRSLSHRIVNADPSIRNASELPNRRTHSPIFITTQKFHSTPRREGLPIIPLFASILKASAALEFTRTAGRIVMTFMPAIIIGNYKMRRCMRHAALHGVPASEEDINKVVTGIRRRTWVLHVLCLIPFTLFWATVIASLERTPLTGRWRLIILSPEEEDEIASQLAGPGWYRAVEPILSQDGAPARCIPTNDWRYIWVNETLRKLEATIPILIRESEMCPEWTELGPNDAPKPPPAEYPLRPRPRASEYLHRICESMCERKVPSPVPHSIPGAPYSLLVVDKPDAANAFSYGFGPDGGGGIVVYSGFLDEIFSRHPVQSLTKETPRSWWSSLFGGVFSSGSTPVQHPVPTDEQTTEMAILLAHELAHLVLSHHLETLSSGTVVIPGVLSIAADVLRVLIFPITMLFGPFVNDAVAQMGKVGSGELTKMGEYCTSTKQEIEADVVSARLLAHAGFDAREAVRFWEARSDDLGECSTPGSPTKDTSGGVRSNLARSIMGASHPVHEIRIEKLKEELERWESERRAEIAHRAA